MLVVEVTNAKFFTTPLRVVHNALPKNNIPLQQCILLEAREGEGLYLTSLDTRTHQITLRVPDAEVFEAGVALVPGELLWDLACTLDEVPLSISVDEQDAELVLQTGGRRLKVALFGQEPAAYQELLEPMPPVVALLDAEDFCDHVKRSLKLTEKSSFVTIAGKDQDVTLYTAVKGRIFNQARLENRLAVEPWSIGVLMDYLAKLPSFTGDAELHLDSTRGVFAISVGEEHMLIRQTTADAISETVDLLMEQEATGYWVAKRDGLESDLKAAVAIKDKRGIAFEVKGNGLFVSCAAKGRGSVKTTHPLVDHDGGEGIKIAFTPQFLQRTFDALGGVDVLAEVLTMVVPGWTPDEPDEYYYSLRFMDSDKPDARKVVVSTLKTHEEVVELSDE